MHIYCLHTNQSQQKQDKQESLGEPKLLHWDYCTSHCIR